MRIRLNQWSLAGLIWLLAAVGANASPNGEPFMRYNVNRGLAEYANVIESGAGLNADITRASYVRLLEEHTGQNYDNDPAKAALAVRSDPDYTLVPCTDAVLLRGIYYLDTGTVKLDQNGRKCRPGEMLLSYKGVLIASVNCGNFLPNQPPTVVHARTCTPVTTVAQMPPLGGNCSVSGGRVWQHGLWYGSDICSTGGVGQPVATTACVEDPK